MTELDSRAARGASSVVLPIGMNRSIDHLANGHKRCYDGRLSDESHVRSVTSPQRPLVKLLLPDPFLCSPSLITAWRSA